MVKHAKISYLKQDIALPSLSLFIYIYIYIYIYPTCNRQGHVCHRFSRGRIWCPQVLTDGDTSSQNNAVRKLDKKQIIQKNGTRVAI